MSLLNKIISYKIKNENLKLRCLGMSMQIPLKSIIKTNKIYIPSDVYGKIYMPYYNQTAVMGSEKPDIYNKQGQKMDVFFLRDIHSAHVPYQYINSKYFIWDRFDIGLDTHFYTHQAMLETMGKPNKRFGLLYEAKNICPNDYLIFDKNQGLEKDFDAILTYDEEILDKLQNAVLFLGCASVFYGQEGDHIPPNPKQHLEKSKNISMICSAKQLTEYHKIRHTFAKKARELGVDIFGSFNHNPIPFKSVALKDYRYQIAIENGVFDYYFTEKILDCFASQTIPIYIGAHKINQFFNMDGIIQIQPDDLENLDKILSNCTAEDYQQRLPAIQDNFNRVLKYFNIFDDFYEQHILKGKIK